MYKDLFKSFCKEKRIKTYSYIEDKDLIKGTLGEDTVTCCIINKLDFSSHRALNDVPTISKVISSAALKIMISREIKL
jgi:hypothetical protein